MSEATRPSSPLRLPLGEELYFAALVLQTVQKGERLLTSLQRVMDEHPQARVSQAAIRDMATEALRNLGWLRFAMRHLAKRTPDDPLLSFLMLVLAQLPKTGGDDTRIQAGERCAAVVIDQAVEFAKQRFPHQVAFVNAIARRYLRECEQLLAQARGNLEAQFNFPGWWVDKLHRAWGPEAANRIMAVAQSAPPMTLRRNKNLRSLAPLPDSVSVPDCPAVFIVPRPTDKIVGFDQGHYSVQDLAAQLAAILLDIQPSDHVLDACAAPGGKTTHLLEFKPARLVAADWDVKRLPRICENLSRYRAFGAEQVEVEQMDLRHWPAARNREFDKILLDAPCSASGIVRRQPEVRWLRKRGDLTTLVADQKAMLAGLWSALKPGGKLLYATCSVFPEENDDVVRSFVDRNADAEWLTLELPWRGMHLAPGRSRSLRLLPSDGVTTGQGQAEYAHDGFYLALLQKRGVQPA